MTDPETTRGARKLESAIRTFALARSISGTSALDIGASTGGFTATLLAHGASEVTAVDVGVGQLARALREDPRVHVHEQTDFRRAPLSFAPGPFDFFCVDVSFMAARNVLRSLAFRLKPGAHGVVLLKPQFELPKSQVRDGDVSDPKLRAQALERFRDKAESHGFTLLGQTDSPVTGGSGTVEILLHLRFEARPSHMPKPGEKLPVRAPAAKRTDRASDAPRTWFAVSAPGLEAPLAEELSALLQLADVAQVDGGVSFSGGLEAGYVANLGSRMATRILVRLGEVEAREFAILRRRMGTLAFERYLTIARPLRIDASARRCRLYHTGALAEALQHAASDRLRAPLQVSKGADGESVAAGGPFGCEPFARLLIRGQEDRFTISVDSSGLLLHLRGARAETGRAPLRETLAAGLLKLAGYRGDEPLVNAMCGAGTIALEAAGIALAEPPGKHRHFAFENFPAFDQSAWDGERARLASAQRSQLPAPIIAFDNDVRALAASQRNATRAELSQHLQLVRGDVRDFVKPAAHGLFIANPPYGQRLGNALQARELYREMGKALHARWHGWRIALLVPREVPPDVFGLAHARSLPLQNGGLRVKLLVAQL